MFGEEEEEDEVVREIDVYVTEAGDPDDPDRPGYALLQYPVRDRKRGPEPFDAARVKPQSRLLEVDVPAVTSGPHFDDKAPDRTKLDFRTLAGAAVPPATNYAVGTLKNGQLHLAPLASTYQLRPSFAYVDAADETEPPAAAPAPPSERRMNPASVKRVPSRAEATQQRTSYSHMRAAQDAEPWTELEVTAATHRSARAKRAKLDLKAA